MNIYLAILGLIAFVCAVVFTVFMCIICWRNWLRGSRSDLFWALFFTACVIADIFIIVNNVTVSTP